jgi:hypothetical protein
VPEAIGSSAAATTENDASDDKQSRELLIPGLDVYMTELREIFGEKLEPYLAKHTNSSLSPAAGASMDLMPIL